MSKVVAIPTKKKATGKKAVSRKVIVKKSVAKKVVTNKAAAKKASAPVRAKLKIMVASTVYQNRDVLLQVCAILNNYGYDVINSEYGTLHPPLGHNNTPACLAAVNECDIFFGLIYPFYSTGITHLEFQEAIRIDKPRRFMAHSYVMFTRKLLEQFMYSDAAKTVRTPYIIQRTSVMDDLRVIDMYNDAIQMNLPYVDRKYHWVQPFYGYDDVFRHVATLFADVKRVERELDNLNTLP
jgi:hypothetical protein